MDFSELGRARIFGIVLAVSVVSALVVAGVRDIGALQIAELHLYDRAKAAFAQASIAPDVVIVPISDADLASWGWPLPDETLATIINAANAAGASAIGIDIYRDRPVGAGHDALASAFDTTGAVGIYSLGVDEEPGIAAPNFGNGPDQHGFSDILVDEDGVTRRALLLVTDASGTKLSLALRLAMVANGQSELSAWAHDPQVLAFAGRPVPSLTDRFGVYRGLDDAGYQMAIDFGRALPVAASISAQDLLAGVATTDLRGKVVVIGTASDAVKDYFRTPLTQSGTGSSFLGIQVHAAIVQQLIDYKKGVLNPLVSPAPIWHVAIILLAALIGGGLAALVHHPLAVFFLGPGFAVLAGAGLTAGLITRVWLPALPVTLAWSGASVATFALLTLLDRVQHRKVAQLFSDHLSPSLAAEVWRNRAVILRGGKPAPMRLFATVLFVDLEGSTAIGGSTEPLAYMTWVSTFLDRIGDVAARHCGFVEKFTGDGIMVVFGAPLPRVTEAEWRRDAESACRCAAAIAAATRDLNDTGQAMAPYRFRIGLHSGSVFGGTIGNRGAMRYNVMGDTVNVAARIESYGKTLRDHPEQGQLICLSDATAQLAKAVARVEKLGNMSHDDARGIFEIYRLIGVND